MAATSCKSSSAKKSTGLISYEMVSITETNEYLEADVTYPQFKKFNSLNKEIARNISALHDAFKATAQQSWQEIDAMRKSYGATENTPPLVHYISCDPIIAGPQYISMLFTIYQDEGGAHGETLLQSVTYDTKLKKTVSITEATGYTIDEIATQCNEYLFANLKYGGDDAESKEARESWIYDGTMADDSNYKIFTYDGKTLTVYFEPYTVAPYAYGVQKVELPAK